MKCSKCGTSYDAEARAERAEARVTQLEEALRRLVDCHEGPGRAPVPFTPTYAAVAAARAVLDQ